MSYGRRVPDSDNPTLGEVLLVVFGALLVVGFIIYKASGASRPISAGPPSAYSYAQAGKDLVQRREP
jgi:hypothetical protein